MVVIKRDRREGDGESEGDTNNEGFSLGSTSLRQLQDRAASWSCSSDLLEPET
jgi:hypothetical protein